MLTLLESLRSARECCFTTEFRQMRNVSETTFNLNEKNLFSQKNLKHFDIVNIHFKFISQNELFNRRLSAEF